MERVVELTTDEVNKIKKMIEPIIRKKMREYKKDRSLVMERFLPSFCGRFAVIRYLGLENEEKLNIKVGNSGKFVNEIHIKKYKLRVNVCLDGRNHIIKKNNIIPSVLVFRNTETKYTIVGVAVPPVLNNIENHRDSNIFGSLLAKNSKTSFTGYDSLIDIDEYLVLYNAFVQEMRERGVSL